MKKQLAVINNIEAYRVTTNSDTNEGRGGTITVGYFVSRAVATEAAAGIGVQGFAGDIEHQMLRVVEADDGKMYLLGAELTLSFESPQKIRARALAKLSEDECRVLGITK